MIAVFYLVYLVNNCVWKRTIRFSPRLVRHKTKSACLHGQLCTSGAIRQSRNVEGCMGSFLNHYSSTENEKITLKITVAHFVSITTKNSYNHRSHVEKFNRGWLSTDIIVSSHHAAKPLLLLVIRFDMLRDVVAIFYQDGIKRTLLLLSSRAVCNLPTNKSIKHKDG